ncbi:MAG TPA: four helix bundle protein [Acidobacteriota bacterium]|nr:four helix bundle protein [Acidobacteriota bacterium]
MVIDTKYPKNLKERTFEFAVDVRSFLGIIPKKPANNEDARQLLRSSGSVGANYLEADNALSHRDSQMRLRICLKEARESAYWLSLLDLGTNPNILTERDRLIAESTELVRIFAAIVRKRSSLNS